MAYRFDGGRGAITCDECNVIFDAYLSPKEATEIYGPEPHYCWKHKDKKVKKDIALSEKKV